MVKILRLPQVGERLGKSRSKIYVDIHDGLLPPPVKIGRRAVGLPDSEVDAVVQARIAGRSHDEVRALVKRLTEARLAA